jgi:hypothetical protein
MKHRFDEALWRGRRDRIIADPRFADMREALPHFPPTSIDLQPENPVKLGEGRFLQLECGDVVGKPYRWSNEPPCPRSFWLNWGDEPLERLRLIRERPRIEHLARKPRKHWDVRRWSPFYMVSDRVLEVLRRFDPGAFETVDIDLVYLRDEVVRGYHLLVFTRALDVVDYTRTPLRVTLRDGRKSLETLVPLAFHADIEPQVHLFRPDIFYSQVYVSRELAAALALVHPHEVRFLDPAGHYHIVRFPGLDSDWE